MKRLLIPLFAGLALPAAVNAEVDPKVHQACMKAADYVGCVQLQSGDVNKKLNRTKIVEDKREKLLLEIKKLPSRLENTSLRDYSSRTLSFTDALAISTPEEVGNQLYFNAKKLALGLDVLYETYNRKIEIGNTYETGRYWDDTKNLKTRNKLNLIFSGNTIEIRCNKIWAGILYGGNRKIGEDIFLAVRDIVITAANQISSGNDGFNFPPLSGNPLIKSSAPYFCPNDPDAPEPPKKKGPNRITSPMDMD